MKKSYEEWCEEFSWDDEFERTDWNSKEELNVAHECCDSMAREVPDKAMFHWISEDMEERETWSYDDLRTRSNQVANMLKDLGVGRGDKVALLLSRRPEMISAFYGIWKKASVAVPLFPALGTDAIKYRIGDSDARYLITDTNNRLAIDEIEGLELEEIITVDLGPGIPEGDVDFGSSVDEASEEFETVRTDPEDICTIIYTSGTTGPPKGELWWHKFIITLSHYLEYFLGVEEDMTIFCGADPAWAVGQAIITAPPLVGAEFLFFEGMFDPIKYFQLLEEYDVDIFAHAPTAFRGMMAASDAIDEYDINLKYAGAIGESLPKTVFDWFKEKLGVAIAEGYGYSEAMMLVNNYHKIDMNFKPGSMGLPSPAWDTALIDDEGNRIEEPGKVGEIAPRNDYGFFLTKKYLGRPEENAEIIESEWRRSGDLAKMDEDGYYWFQGRKDDIIISSGYRIGPEEVEDAILSHGSVANCAAIGEPDEERGEIVKAYVVLKEGEEPSEEIKEEITQQTRKKLGKHAYPREIEFIDEIPMTPAGKIQRFKLRERE